MVMISVANIKVHMDRFDMNYVAEKEPFYRRNFLVTSLYLVAECCLYPYAINLSLETEVITYDFISTAIKIKLSLRLVCVCVCV